MTHTAHDKDDGREKLFEIIRQKNRANSKAARIRRIALLKETAVDLEHLKLKAMRSLQANR